MRTEKCVLYTRSSKDGHDISPAAQRTELRGYAERKGYRIVGDYSDAAVSANDNPPQLAEMLRELKNPKRPWGVILAVESSRIARDVDLAGVINFQVRKAGARIEYAKQPPSANPAMDMMRDSIMRGFDMYWSMLSREKGLAGMRENVSQGHRAGGLAPLGYQLQHTPTGAIRHGEAVTKSKLIPDPEWAPRVKRYLAKRIAGAKRIVASSEMKDVPTTTLISIERNALTYAGVTCWNRHVEKKLRNVEGKFKPRDVWVLQRGTHEAFISEADAERLMAAALPRPERRRGPAGAYLLAGLVYAPDGKRLTASGDGYLRKGKGRRIPVEELEAIVRETMNEDVDAHEFTTRYLAELRREADKLPTVPARLEAERAAVVKKIANLLRLAEKNPDSGALGERLRILEAEQRALDGQLASAGHNAELREAVYAVTEDQAQEMLAAWMERDGASLDDLRAALVRMVDRIEFDPATGEGRITYKIEPAPGAGHFSVTNRGMRASPRGFEPRLPP